MKRFLTAFLAGLTLVACATLEPPKTFVEQLAYAEAGAQAALRTIGDLTCPRYDATRQCVEPGKPLSAAQAKSLLDSVSKARTGLKTAAAMGPEGGKCLDQEVKSAEACLGLARTLLLELERQLRTYQGRS